MYIKSSIWSGFAIKTSFEDQFQSSPKLVGICTVLKCIFVPNLEIVTSIGVELWHGQAQNGVNFDFGVQFDLEVQGRLSPQTIGILTKVIYTYGPHLVILAWTGYRADKHVIDAHTDGHTDRQAQATTIPEGQNWPRVNIDLRIRHEDSSASLLVRSVFLCQSIKSTQQIWIHACVCIYVYICICACLQVDFESKWDNIYIYIYILSHFDSKSTSYCKHTI